MFDSRHGELPVASTMLTSALASAVPMAAVPCSTESATTGGVVDSLLLPPPQAPRKPAEVASAASRARRCLFMCFLVARQPSRSAPTCPSNRGQRGAPCPSRSHRSGCREVRRKGHPAHHSSDG